MKYRATLLICLFAVVTTISSSEGSFAQRGGRRGDRERGGGGPGGFDPSSFLNRLDKNGNGSIDPEEQQGPAKFFLERMARNNRSIDLSKPIKLSTITEEFQRMRGGRGGESSDKLDSATESSGPKPLVLGFGLEEPLPVVPGFGDEAEFFAVRVTEADTKLATDRMRRYDRNRDGSLDAEELRRGRFDNNPLQFDRNGDNRLSISELSIRYAKRREDNQTDSDGRNNSRPNRGPEQNGRNRWNQKGGNNDQRNKKEKKKESLWKDRASYRVTRTRGQGATIEGLPSWFTRDDRDGNGQVSMREYASSWNDELIEEFFQIDINEDGLITSDEALKAVEGGTVRGSVKKQDGKFSREGLPANAEQRWVNWCEKKLKELDKDRNGFITVKEWRSSGGKFNEVDGNSDGKISLAEYYNFRRR